MSIQEAPPTFRVPLQFNDGEPVLITERAVFTACPTLGRALAGHYPSWEESETVLSQSLEVPFARVTGLLLLDHVLHYPPPFGSHISLATYPAASARTPHELKELIELANFLECDAAVHVVGYVIAQKIMDWSAEAIAAFLDLPLNEARLLEDFDPDVDWMHPPIASFIDNNSPQSE